MATEWRTVPIRDLCLDIFDGPHATPKKMSSGPVFLGISSLVDGRLDLDESAHISEADFAMWTRRVTPRPGDVVFSYETRLGEAAIIPQGLRCCLGRRMALMRPDPAEVDARFLLYAYLGPAFQATIRERTVHGSTVERILLTEFPEFPIAVPDLHTQRSIADLLGALDDKIDVNRRRNRTLESIARAIFKSWFVDFDPVRRKVQGGEVGLPPDLAECFPDALTGSPIGPIPAGWGVCALGEIAEVIDCLHSKKPTRRQTGRPLLQLSNIREDGLLAMDDVYWIDDRDYEQWTSKFEARHGDCVITNVGRVGAVAQLPAGTRAALGRNMTGIRCKAGFPYPTFLIQALLSDATRREIREKTDTGTILEALNVRSIPALRCVIPPPACLDKLEAVLGPLRQLMEALLREVSTLADARDTLLPRLLSDGVDA